MGRFSTQAYSACQREVVTHTTRSLPPLPRTRNLARLPGEMGSSISFVVSYGL